MALTLYYAPGACSLVPHVALEEAQASFDTVRLNLAGGDQRAPDYLAINAFPRPASCPATIPCCWRAPTSS
jgi:glutathione S-transferase